eukprot:4394560-Lingulodinium_polyedra.AAC.1
MNLPMLFILLLISGSPILQLRSVSKAHLDAVLDIGSIASCEVPGWWRRSKTVTPTTLRKCSEHSGA